MTKLDELVEKYIQMSLVDWDYMFSQIYIIKWIISDLRSLTEPKADIEAEYVKVPKETYDKMVWECTLAAIRRWDFTEANLTPSPCQPTQQEVESWCKLRYCWKCNL